MNTFGNWFSQQHDPNKPNTQGVSIMKQKSKKSQAHRPMNPAAAGDTQNEVDAQTGSQLHGSAPHHGEVKHASARTPKRDPSYPRRSNTE